MITPTFVNVDNTDFKIDDLTLQGVPDTMASVQIVNADGTWGTMGVWLNEFVDGDTVYPAGWFTDASGVTAADIKLKPGQALFFETSSETAAYQTAGQVSGDITYSLSEGYSMIGNATPATLPIDSLTLKNVPDTMASVQVVNPDGSWGTMGVWLNEFIDGDTVYPAGWFTDASGVTPADITLAPGQSVFFETSISGAKAVIPSAL